MGGGGVSFIEFLVELKSSGAGTTFSEALAPLEVGSLHAQQIPIHFPPFRRLPYNM